MPTVPGLLNRVIERYTASAVRFGAALEAAQSLGRSPLAAFRKTWRVAVNETSFAYLPDFVRERLDVVVDVGANRGDFSRGILTLANPRHLVAFEPNPAVFPLLEAALRGTVAECVCAAVGAEVGSAVLLVEPQSELSSVVPLTSRGRRLHGIAEPTSTRVEVPLTTLDAALAGFPRISLLKLDVQGLESAVVAGAQATLARTDCLLTEVLYETDYYEGAMSCVQLCSLIERVSPLRLSCITRPRLGPGSLGVWADAVFVRDDLPR